MWRVAVLGVAVLAAATLILTALRLVRSDRSWSEARARVRSWWVIAPLAFAAAAAPIGVAILLFVVLSAWSLHEFLRLAATRTADRTAAAAAFASVPVQYAWVIAAWYGLFVIFIPVYMFTIIPVVLVLGGEPRGFVSSAARIQWGLMAFVFGVSHMAYLRTFPPYPSQPGVDGSSLLLFLVVVVEMSDVLQYVWGKSVGRHRIMPTISPAKTWEGFLGGVLCASALAVGLRFLTPFGALEAFGVGLLVTVTGFLGGAVLSAAKRDLGVKDWGRSIPGHGGIVDRLDALCFAGPLFLHYVRYFHG